MRIRHKGDHCASFLAVTLHLQLHFSCLGAPWSTRQRLCDHRGHHAMRTTVCMCKHGSFVGHRSVLGSWGSNNWNWRSAVPHVTLPSLKSWTCQAFARHVDLSSCKHEFEEWNLLVISGACPNFFCKKFFFLFCVFLSVLHVAVYMQHIAVYF